MDCDRPGRQAAARIAADLERRGVTVGIADLDPRRQDGYDVSDWLRTGGAADQLLRPPALYSASAYKRLADRPAGTGPEPRPQAKAARASLATRSIGPDGKSVGCSAS
jgi:hypothetical protein